jgi:hypothetical protein
MAFCIAQPWASLYIDTFQCDLLLEYSSVNPLDNQRMDGLMKCLKNMHRVVAKLRYREEKAELQRREVATARTCLNSIVLAGFAKRPNEYTGPPLALSTSDDSSDFMTSPSGIKEATVSYFQSLYRRTHRASQPKLWMDSTYARKVHSETSADRFQWPRPFSLVDARWLLNRGKPRPCPGPDGWEKWWIRSLSDRALRLVLVLMNYQITQSHLPQCVKDTNISLIHKRGPSTSLSNHRGIACSNFIVNFPFAWLNQNLTSYISSCRTSRHITRDLRAGLTIFPVSVDGMV